MARPGTLAMLAFAALAVAGCGETVIDPGKTEGAIRLSLEGSLHRKVPSVECPSGQKVESGETFTCKVGFQGGRRATVTLKILDPKADVSMIRLSPSK